MKLPDPEGKIAYEANEYESEWISSQDAYTVDQMLQFRLDALEEAAEICHCIGMQRVASAMECETALRSLKEKRNE